MMNFQTPRSGSPLVCRSCSRLLWWALLSTVGLPLMAQSSPCTVDLSESVVDYGPMVRSELLARASAGAAQAVLGDRTATVFVRCDKPRQMGLAVEAGSAQRNNDKVNVTYRVVDVQLDGHPVQLVSSRDSEKIVSALAPGDRVQTRAPEQGKVLAVQLQVNTRVNMDSTRVIHRTTWENSTVFQVFMPQASLSGASATGSTPDAGRS